MSPVRASWLVLFLLVVSPAVAVARDYYKYVPASSTLRTGDRVRPGFVRHALTEPRRAGFEKMLETTRRELIRDGQIPRNTPARANSVFAGIRRGTWKSFLPNAKLIRVEPVDANAVATLDHNHLDHAWSAWQKASQASGGARETLHATAHASAVRYWTSPPSAHGKPEALLGRGATVVRSARSPTVR